MIQQPLWTTVATTRRRRSSNTPPLLWWLWFCVVGKWSIFSAVVVLALLIEVLSSSSLLPVATGLSISGSNGGHSLSASSSLWLERFHVICPANPSSWMGPHDPFFNEAQQGDSSNNSYQNHHKDPTNDDNNNNSDDNDKEQHEEDWMWAAVYRSNDYYQHIATNQPWELQLLQDEELFQAAAAAAAAATSARSAPPPPQQQQRETIPPVAIACLRPATIRMRTTDPSDGEIVRKAGDDAAKDNAVWILDHLRCTLPKEETDVTCEGGSEHTEALSIAIDALLVQYLLSSSTTHGRRLRFDAAIRAKATLVVAPLLERRGFVPVQFLSRDMATHVSSLDDCLQQYAQRATMTTTTTTVTNAISATARQRALSIVSYLGRMDRIADLAAAADHRKKSRTRSGGRDAADKGTEDGEDDDEIMYDPWSTVNRL